MVPEPNEQPSTPGAALRAAKRSGLLLRILVGVPMLAVVLGLIVYSPPMLQLLILLAMASYGTWEYVGLITPVDGTPVARASLMLVAMLPVVGGAWWGLAGLSAAMSLALTLVLLRTLFRGEGLGNGSLAHGGLALVGLAVVGWPIAHVGLLLSLPGGGWWIVHLVLTMAASDTAAYAVGSSMGRHRLLPAVSPRKSVEGLVAALAAGAAVGLLGPLWLQAGDPFGGRGGLALLGVALAFAGQLGDLLESKIKRDTGAGDSGRLLPGHGGFLDRWDSFILTPPLLFYTLWVVSA